MTAADILNQWEQVQAVFVQPSAWIAMLRIIEAGENGLLAKTLRPGRGRVDTRLVKKWEAAGLVTKSTRRHRGSRSAFFLHATPKARQLLRVEPTA